MSGLCNRQGWRELAGAAMLTACLGLTAVAAPASAAAAGAAAPASAAAPAGTVQTIRVYGASLAGNLQGNDAERDVHVYLPPGYATSQKHYPVVYFLHGYAVTADIYVNDVLRIPDSADAAMGDGAREVIVVMPDAFTRFGGSFYSSSPTIGDWERFIARDLVAYIDSHYRTLPRRESRGLSGHSMGGYGTLRIGMAYPQVFGALYAMSSAVDTRSAPTADATRAQHERMAGGELRSEPRSMDNGLLAQASAWSPNPQKPPYYFDLPFDADGQPVPLVAERWIANSPLVALDQNVPALQGMRGIKLDVGDQDSLVDGNTLFAGALARLGIPHEYEIYEGTHGNKVGERFIANVLPFFEQHLDAQ